MNTDVRPKEIHVVSARIIEAAIELAIEGKMTAEKAIEYGCMTPGCLTAETILLVARDANLDLRELFS